MDYWASAEVYKDADPSLDKIRRIVEPLIKDAMSKSSLKSLQAKLRFIPIVMPSNMHARYTERTMIRKRERIYDIAPILDYETFVSGSIRSQLKEYVRGLSIAQTYLPMLGATDEQCKEFANILDYLASYPVDY